MALRSPAGPDGEKKTLIATEQDRPAVARFRRRWRAHQHRIDPDRLVFLDETWIRTDMTRLRGWCQRGAPLLAKVPHGRWRTLTFIAGLRRGEVVAPCVFDGPINGELFTAWVEQSLAPTLKPRDVVVLDNLGSHKGQRARNAVRAAGAHLLFLRPLAPISIRSRCSLPSSRHCSAKPTAAPSRSSWREVGNLLDRFSPAECAAYLRHAGYGAITA